jgi:hypothetical protein
MEHLHNDPVTADIRHMDKRLTELEEKIDDINTKLTQVVDAILGNPLTKTGGFVEDIRALKDEMESLKRRVCKQEDFKKRVYIAGTIVVAILIAVQYFTTIYANLKR